MQMWMIVVAIVLATLIMIIGGMAISRIKKSRLVQEVKEGVQAVQGFQARYPTVDDYAVDVERELFIQKAPDTLLKDVLGDRYRTELSLSHKRGEEPMHFTDRWLYSLSAPQRWDFIEGMMLYYFDVVHHLLEAQLRPTPTIEGIGGKQAFQETIETSFTRGVAAHLVVSRYFKVNQ